MDLSRYVVLDCTSGTFFNAAHAVLIDVDALPDHDEALLNEGSDAERCDLAETYGIDLETWSPPKPDSPPSAAQLLSTEEFTLLDEQALDRLAALLGDQEWTPEHLEQVAEIVRATGRDINDLDADAPAKSSSL